MVLLQLRAIQEVFNSNFDTLANNSAHCTTKQLSHMNVPQGKTVKPDLGFHKKNITLYVLLFAMAF